MTETKALAKQNGNALSVDNDWLRKQAQFLKMTLPYGKDLTDENAIALSAYCETFGLNAQNGEAYFLVQVKQNGERRELGLYPGIKAWRKKAKEQLHATDQLATYKIDFERVDPSELGIVKADTGKYHICIRAKLTDDVSRSKYLGQFVQLLGAGLKKDEIEDLIGKPPFWYGYGTVQVRELPYLKMEPLRVAEKRAEKDATSRRFDLPFADDALADDVDAGLVENIEDTPITQRTMANKSPDEILGELYGEPVNGNWEPVNDNDPVDDVPVVEIDEVGEAGTAEFDQEIEGRDHRPDTNGKPARKGNAGPTAFWKRVNELGTAGKLTQEQAQAIAEKHGRQDWPAALQELEATYA